MMVDVWSDLNRDESRERFEAALDAAQAALAPKFAFVSEATTKASFTDRLDLVDRDVERIITAATRRDPSLFAPVHEAVMTQWEADFDQIQFARSEQAQKTSNKRSWWRRRKREAAKTAGLSEERQRQVDSRWNANISWNAPFETKLNDVLVGTFYDDDDYDEIKAYLTSKYGSTKTAAAGPDPYATGYEDGSGSHRPDGSEFTGEDRESYDDGYDAGAQQVNKEGSRKTAVQHDTCVHCGRSIETLDDQYDDTWFHTDSGLYPCDPSQVDPEALFDNEGDKYDIATPHEALFKGAPFAGYADFAACVAAHQDADDPNAYCGYIKHRVEDGKTGAKFTGRLSMGDLVAANQELAKFALCEELRRRPVVSHAYTGRKGGIVALTLVREGSLTHWAVTDEEGDQEKGAGSTPTVRDALEQAWDVLNKVLDKEPPPAEGIVTEVEQAADATSEAVEEAGGEAPEEQVAEDGKPITDPEEPVVDPADPQPEKGAPVDATGEATKEDLEAKPDAPVDDAEVDPKDVKVDPEAVADPDDPANADTKVIPEGEAPPVDDKGDKPQPGEPAASAETKPADGAVPPVGEPTTSDVPEDEVPEAVVDKAEEESGGDVAGIEPSKMDTGQRASMTFTMADGTVGDADVTFLREENDIYFFDGPAGEFGIGERDGQWVDADGNSFAFSEGNAVDEVVPDGSGDITDINLDAPVDQPAIAGDPKPVDAEAAPSPEGDDKPDFIKDKEGDGKEADDAEAPESDDKSDDDGESDDGKKKSKPPWAKAKESMLAENPDMNPAQAERLAKRAMSLAETLR